MKFPIPQTNIKIVITTEKAINDLVNRLIAEKRRTIFNEGYQIGRDDVIDLGPMVQVLDLPPYEDKPV